DVLFGGQLFGTVGNDTLIGGPGNETFECVLPTAGSAVETIRDAFGNGQIDLVGSGDSITTLGGSSTQRLSAVQGTSDTWQDEQSTLYQFNTDTRQLTITGGSLGGDNQIVIDDFNLAAAEGAN